MVESGFKFLAGRFAEVRDFDITEFIIKHFAGDGLDVNNIASESEGGIGAITIDEEIERGADGAADIASDIGGRDLVYGGVVNC